MVSVNTLHDVAGHERRRVVVADEDPGLEISLHRQAEQIPGEFLFQLTGVRSVELDGEAEHGVGEIKRHLT